MTLRVFYSPIQTNRIIVSKLQTLTRFQSCEFIPLAEDQFERRKQLKNIRGRGVYLWGDGESHHESYYFTKLRSMKLKINVDYHTDYYGTKEELSCGNHMLWSKERGKKIIVPESRVSRTKKPESYLRLMMELAKKVGLDYFEGEVALTIDLDGITGMPVLSKWLASMGTIDYKEIVELIKTLDCRIFRLDIGGIIENLPEFELRELPSETVLTKENLIPFYFELNPEFGLGSAIPKEQLVSIVGSYVVRAYAEILETFLQIHEATLGIQSTERSVHA